MVLMIAQLLAISLASRDAFHPGEVWLDTDGVRIRAHQPHIFGPLNGTYYWYGAAKVGSSDGDAGVVNVYTSRDLYNWDFRGVAFNSTVNGRPGYVARPSMLGRHPHTGQYVLWAKGGGKSFQAATSFSPLGPFRRVGSYDPAPNTTAGDSAAFLDPVSGTQAFYVYSQHIPTRAMKVLRLDDATWTVPDSTTMPASTVPGHLEAPAPFYSAASKRYHIWSSHTSGWKPNAAQLLRADAMWGAPWAAMGNPSGSKVTFSTQGSHILPLKVINGTQRLLYMGDRYEPYINTSEGSRYIMLPMEVRADGTVHLLNTTRTWRIQDWPST
eukprot:g1425.t1